MELVSQAGSHRQRIRGYYEGSTFSQVGDLRHRGCFDAVLNLEPLRDPYKLSSVSCVHKRLLSALSSPGRALWCVKRKPMVGEPEVSSGSQFQNIPLPSRPASKGHGTLSALLEPCIPRYGARGLRFQSHTRKCGWESCANPSAARHSGRTLALLSSTAGVSRPVRCGKELQHEH